MLKNAAPAPPFPGFPKQAPSEKDINAILFLRSYFIFSSLVLEMFRLKILSFPSSVNEGKVISIITLLSSFISLTPGALKKPFSSLFSKAYF
jgi:hypothetical protein